MKPLKRREDVMPMPIKKKQTLEELEKENAELRQKNLRLTIESEYVKKLSALVQEREDRESKKSHKQ
jgi:hypothetical protein